MRAPDARTRKKSALRGCPNGRGKADFRVGGVFAAGAAADDDALFGALAVVYAQALELTEQVFFVLGEVGGRFGLDRDV